MYHIEISSEEIKKLQKQSVMMGLGDEVRQKLEWFLFYLESGKSVSQTCVHFGIARSTFYRWVQRFDPQDLRTLEEKSHRPRMLRQTKVSQTLSDLVRMYRMQNPYLGKEHIAELLEAEHTITVSPSTIGRIITQGNLYFGDSLLHRKKRNENFQEMTSPQMYAQSDEVEMPAFENTETELAQFVHAWRALVRCVWRRFRRPIIMTSLLSNIVFIGLLLMTAAWENAVSEKKATQAAIQLETEGRAAAPVNGARQAAAPVNGARQAAAPSVPHIETHTIIHE